MVFRVSIGVNILSGVLELKYSKVVIILVIKIKSNILMLKLLVIVIGINVKLLFMVLLWINVSKLYILFSRVFISINLC